MKVVVLFHILWLGLLMEMSHGRGITGTLSQDRESKDQTQKRRGLGQSNDISAEEPGISESHVSPYHHQYDLIQPDHRRLEDVCFNKKPPIEKKFKYSDLYSNGVHKTLYPLSRRDYPIHGRFADTLKTETSASSPMTYDDYMLNGTKAVEYCKWLESPLHPTGNPYDPFWGEFRKVIEVREARERGDHPSTISTWPYLWKDFSLVDIANAVKNEYPNSEQAGLLEYFWNNGGIKMDHSIIKKRSELDPVGLEFSLPLFNSWVISVVSPYTFACKWTYGCIRPEDIAYLISQRKFTVADGVPRDIVAKIKKMKLKNAFDFTGYKDIGCPTHPSYPAMHSSGSTASIWLPVVAHLTAEQYCEVLRMDLGVAHARVVAGVHYYQDNYAGLNFGAKVIADKLPKFLAEYFDADPYLVEKKLKKLRFDWKDFDPKHCTIKGEYVGERLLK